MTFVVYMVIQLAVSVGLHRYYTHRAFECSRFWQYFFAIVGTLSFHASPIAFVHAHHTHHKYADTEKDSHIVGWQFFLVRRYRVPEGMNSRVIVRLTRDPFQVFLLHYGALLCWLTFGILFLVSPNMALFGYVAPIALYFFQPQSIRQSVIPKKALVICSGWSGYSPHQSGDMRITTTIPIDGTGAGLTSARTSFG